MRLRSGWSVPVLVASLAVAGSASASSLRSMSVTALQQRLSYQHNRLQAHRGAIAFFMNRGVFAPPGRPIRITPSYRMWWQEQAVRWTLREIAETEAAMQARQAPEVSSVGYWEAKQIAAAEIIGAESHTKGGDPWPNCPDPFDGGGSWYDTVSCENGGSWYDSPGYYRCGLQFDPMWENRFGKLCP